MAVAIPPILIAVFANLALGSNSEGINGNRCARYFSLNSFGVTPTFDLKTVEK